MKLFKCQHCGLVIFFYNRSCEQCGHTLGYLPVNNELSALEPANGGLFTALAVPGVTFKFCANATHDACNWLIPSNSSEEFCLACRHNRTVPDLNNEENMREWRKMELAKHQLFYTLLLLKLPLPNRDYDPKRGLCFDFLADKEDGKKILTGHDEGIITISLKEADDSEREKRRTSMHEPYRTLVGHFRHEIGHYYWDRLVADEHREEQCRALFGDDRADYGDALKRHYKNGAPANWREHFVSAYATSHPWEDFAETWAHYLHIVDSLDTSRSFGLQVHPEISSSDELNANAFIDPYQNTDFQQFITTWLPLTYALNAMNRSMGLNDAYPFVLSPDVIKKLTFIHFLVHAPRQTIYGAGDKTLSVA